MKKIYLTVAFLVTVTLTGCFQILHYLQLNDDGSIDVYWQFDISRALAEKDGEGGSVQGPNNESILDKIDKSKNEMPEKLKSHVTDLVVKKISDEYVVGIAMSFKAKKYVSLPKGERFPLLPQYKRLKKCLVFSFEPEEKDDEKGGKEAVKKEEPAKDNEKGSQDADQFSRSMEKLTSSILSSARYQVILGGNYHPVRAEVKGVKTGKRYSVSITRLGDQHLMMIPFMAISMEETEGFDFIVYLDSGK